MTRRDLLGLVGTGLASSAMATSQSAGKLPIAVSTLGCPKWDWNTIVKNTSGGGSLPSSCEASWIKWI